VDPVVFFKLQLVMFFEDIRSERQLMGVVSDRLSLRWYLGYDLNESLPDHSSLTRIRERYGLEAFRGFFERIVQECFEAGLVRGEELFFDATKVEADAAVDSLAPRWFVEGYLHDLFEKDAPVHNEDAREVRDADDAGSDDEDPVGELPTAGDRDLTRANPRAKTGSPVAAPRIAHSSADDSAAYRSESTTDWLKRSTHPRARAARCFLSENLSAMPGEHRATLYRMLHERWHSAFFELIVGRTLQVLGATLEAEPGGASDTRVDFVARFPDATVAVEAVSPVFGPQVGETARRSWLSTRPVPPAPTRRSTRPFLAGKWLRGALTGSYWALRSRRMACSPGEVGSRRGPGR